MSDILIIGGGVSGLSAGIYALRNGHKATICEKHFLTGGNLTAWNRRGFTVDTCIHWLTGTNKNTGMYKMWEDLGVLNDSIMIKKPECLFTVEHDGESLSLYRDFERTYQRMLELSPTDKKEIDSFRKCVDAMHGVVGTFGPEKNKLFSWYHYVPYIPVLFKYYTHSTKEIADRFKHPLLKLFMNSLMGYDFNAVDFAFVVATFTGDNADIPDGLSKPMAERMTEKFISLGGTLLTGKEAEKINVNNGIAESVDFKDGSNIKADYILLCMDPITASRSLLDTKLPKKLNKQINNTDYKYFSSYHVEFTVDTDNVPFTESLFIEVPEDKKEAVGNRRIIVRDFTSEPGFSKEGKRNLQAMIYCNGDRIKEFLEAYDKGKEEYLEFKQKKVDAVMSVIEERFPEYKGKINILDAWTPATYRRFTGAHMGTFQSFINPKWKAPIPVKNRLSKVKNVILASQWQMSPGGLPAAASAGRRAIKAIDGYLK